MASSADLDVALIRGWIGAATGHAEPKRRHKVALPRSVSLSVADGRHGRP
ncbi:MAG: hypothetical protein JWN81_2319 [Solirubrobacterales bacterium]|nr:hypothetical protein [Solirubrobacterales bacterium]